MSHLEGTGEELTGVFCPLGEGVMLQRDGMCSAAINVFAEIRSCLSSESKEMSLLQKEDPVTTGHILLFLRGKYF